MILMMIYELCAARQMPCSRSRSGKGRRKKIWRRRLCRSERISIFMIMIVRYVFSSPSCISHYAPQAFEGGKFIEIWWVSLSLSHLLSFFLRLCIARMMDLLYEWGRESWQMCESVVTWHPTLVCRYSSLINRLHSVIVGFKWHIYLLETISLALFLTHSRILTGCVREVWEYLGIALCSWQTSIVVIDCRF